MVYFLIILRNKQEYEENLSYYIKNKISNLNSILSPLNRRRVSPVLILVHSERSRQYRSLTRALQTHRIPHFSHHPQRFRLPQILGEKEVNRFLPYFFCSIVLWPNKKTYIVAIYVTM